MTIHHSQRIPHENLHDLESVARIVVAVAFSFAAPIVAGVELARLVLRPRAATHPLDRPS